MLFAANNLNLRHIQGEIEVDYFGAYDTYVEAFLVTLALATVAHDIDDRLIQFDNTDHKRRFTAYVSRYRSGEDILRDLVAMISVTEIGQHAINDVTAVADRFMRSSYNHHALNVVSFFMDANCNFVVYFKHIRLSNETREELRSSNNGDTWRELHYHDLFTERPEYATAGGLR